MNRKYTIEEYRILFNKLRERIPEVSITTDIIVGFPNETDEDFEETLKIYNEFKYDLAYTFIYSKREGTPASVMEDLVPLEVKEERLQRLNEVVNKYALDNNKKYLDKVVPVLIEGPSEKNGKLMGYTETMKLVNIEADESLIGEIVPVRITDVKTWSLEGVVESDR